MNKIFIADDAEDIFGMAESLSDLASKIKAKKTDKDVLFIYVNLKFHNSKRAEQTGIELLIWLRLKDVLNHCVLHSFETVHALLNRQPKHLVATSKGTSFVQQPIILDRINITCLEGERAEPENLRRFLKPAFSIQEFRHAYANIWGLKKLIEAHKMICPKENLSFNTNDVSNSVGYHIAEYIFQPPNNLIDSYSIRLAREALSYLRNKSRLNILYIDDQADNGWYAFLKNLFNTDVQLCKFDLKSNDFVKLFPDFRKSIVDNQIDLVISDLRLFVEEDEILDYDDFISIRLMKKIRSEKNYGRLVFPNLSYMLFTASNKLTYYKSMIKGKTFAPQGLFIKEGFDLLYNQKQSFNNYFQLLKTLDTFFAVYKRRQGEMVELWDEEECRKTFTIENSIKNNLEEQQQAEIAKRLSGYTHVVLDTNVYFHFYNIPLSKTNIFLTYPVYKELIRNVKEDYNSCIGFLAKYFTDNFQSDKSCLSQNAIAEIDRKFNSGESVEDLADGFFVQMLNHYAAIPNASILFITNDWKDKGGKISAGNQVENWIKNSRIANVKVVKPNDLFIIENKKSNFNHTKNKLSQSANHPKSNNRAQSSQSFQTIQNKQQVKRTNKILKIALSNSRQSFNFSLDNCDVISIPTSVLGTKTLKDLSEMLHNSTISYSDKNDFEKQIIEIIKTKN